MSNNKKQISKSVRSQNANRSASGGSHTVNVGGNVTGLIVNGDNNEIQYEVNNMHGAVINNNYGSRPAVKQWDVKPQPPRPPREFIGRENELKTLEGLIKAKSAVIIHGHNGIGKTTLVKQAANSSVATTMRNGVVYERALDDAGELFEFEDLLQRLFDALFESNPPLKVSVATARTHLSGTKPLVILDGYDLSPAILRSLPDFFPQGSLLITSQSGYQSEEFDSVALLPLPRKQSVELLITKAGLQRNPQEASLLNELCQLLEDVPLAITTIARVIREKRITLPEASSQLN